MSHFAQIDENNLVIQVLVIEQEEIDTGLLGDPSRWIKTSYNTHAGVHSQGGTPLRMNFAGVGMTYDPVRDAFIPQQPYASWILNESTCQWEPPVPLPERTNKFDVYVWDELQTAWVLPDAGTQ